MINRVMTLVKSKFIRDKKDFICLSPVCHVSQLIILTVITVTYKRPAARGRIMMGGIVPFGKLWRTGAGACTTIHFSRAVSISDIRIPMGSYALFTIPELNEWTIILNRNYKQDGGDQYEPEKNILSIKVPTQQTDRFYESFSIDIDVVNNNTGVLYLSWEYVQVKFSITAELSLDLDYMNRLQQL